MKALFLSLPLTGHVNPTLPLVRELVRDGDEVVYYSTAAYAGGVGTARAQFRPYRNAFLADMKHLPEQLHELSWLLMRTNEEVLEEHLEEFRELQPDYVITDSVAPWGQWVGEILGVPVVTSVSTVAFNRQVLAFAARQGVQPKSARLVAGKLRAVTKAIMLGRRLRARYGVQGTTVIGTVAGRSDLNIVYTSRYFQPCGDTFDARYEFVGPSIGDRLDPGEFPWESIREDAILLYVSLGTLFNADRSFYRNCFEAFGDLDLQVILSVGGNVPLDDLGPAPPNFIVRERVPQVEVLRRASVFVTHGGMNSVSESLSFGVPMVVIPQMSEQAIVARRVEGLGAGVYLAKEDVTTDRLSESVLHVLGDPRFGDRAARVQASFAESGGVSRAADAIFAFTGR